MWNGLYSLYQITLDTTCNLICESSLPQYFFQRLPVLIFVNEQWAWEIGYHNTPPHKHFILYMIHMYSMCQQYIDHSLLTSKFLYVCFVLSRAAYDFKVPSTVIYLTRSLAPSGPSRLSPPRSFIHWILNITPSMSNTAWKIQNWHFLFSRLTIKWLWLRYSCLNTVMKYKMI